MDSLYSEFDAYVMKTSGERLQGNEFRAVKRIQHHISNLPESVICHILSRLPTKDAVRTSILSRDWKYKWTCIYDVDIYYELDSEIVQNIFGHSYPPSIAEKFFDLNMNFFRFVDRILDFTHGSKLRSFRLSCLAPYVYDHVQAWIPRVLGRNVENLDIELRLHPKIMLPLKLCSCSSLIKLKLLTVCTLKIDSQICFPTLKTLYIGEKFPDLEQEFEIVNEQSLDTRHMLMIFPVLEVLELHNVTWLKAESVEIRAPELIEFKASYRRNGSKTCPVNICGPKLAKFEFERILPDNFIVNAPNVTHASLMTSWSTERWSLPACKLLKWFPRLKCLKLLSSCDLFDLTYCPDSCFPTLDQLQELEICPYMLNRESFVWIKSRVLPSLQSLALNLQDCRFRVDEGEVFSPCILSQVKEVKFLNHNGDICTIDVIKFILQTAKGLKRLSVSGRMKIMTESEITSLLPTLLPENSTTALIVNNVVLSSPTQAVSFHVF